MRLFAALQLSEDMKSALADTAAELAKLGKGRFTRTENLHLTLAFIGETPASDAAVEALGDWMRPALK